MRCVLRPHTILHCQCPFRQPHRNLHFPLWKAAPSSLTQEEVVEVAVAVEVAVLSWELPLCAALLVGAELQPLLQQQQLAQQRPDDVLPPLAAASLADQTLLSAASARASVYWAAAVCSMHNGNVEKYARQSQHLPTNPPALPASITLPMYTAFSLLFKPALPQMGVPWRMCYSHPNLQPVKTCSKGEPETMFRRPRKGENASLRSTGSER